MGEAPQTSSLRQHFRKKTESRHLKPLLFVNTSEKKPSRGTSNLFSSSTLQKKKPSRGTSNLFSSSTLQKKTESRHLKPLLFVNTSEKNPSRGTSNLFSSSTLQK